MSDRVVIIGGSEVGRDHLPYPQYATDSGISLPTTQYPLGFNVVDFCKIFYVVKRWSLNINATWKNADGTFSGGLSLIFEPFLVPDVGDPYVMTRESEVVLYRNTFLGWSNEEGYEPPTNAVSDSVITEFELTDAGLSDYALTMNYTGPLFYEGLFYFDLEVFVNVDGIFSCQTHPTKPRSVGSVIFNGLTPIPLLSNNLTVDGYGVLSCDVTVAAVKFWPYALRDVSPVWDEDSGAQLEDPLTDYDVGDIEETITQQYPPPITPDFIEGVPSTLVIHRNPSPWIAV